jgi:hypothetical protein
LSRFDSLDAVVRYFNVISVTPEVASHRVNQSDVIVYQ